MSIAGIEAELEKLTADELRQLALKSWTAYMQKQGRMEPAFECDEDDPRLLLALDKAIGQADATPGPDHSASEVRARLNQWTLG